MKSFQNLLTIWEKIRKSIESSETSSNQTNNIPSFQNEDATLRRYELRFEGYVQGVGFRFEMYHKANQIGVTGWTRNLPDGSVEAQVQGTEEKIAYLIDYMYSIRRIQITDFSQHEIPLQEGEDMFVPVY